MSGFWSKKNADRSPFADKDVMEETEHPFRITAVAIRESSNTNFGPQLVMTCESIFGGDIGLDEPILDGATFNIGLGMNDAREELYTALLDSLTDGESLYATVTSFTAKSGNRAYDIVEYRGDTNAVKAGF